ncbi:MAG: hypothetical protein WD557_01305 [Dehalococcoidia bacterium]
MSLKKGESRTRNIARMGGYAVQSQQDTGPRLVKARAAFASKFHRDVDPEGVLSPEERDRRAAAARKLFYVGMAYKSAEAQRRRKAGKGR